jgi:CBS domain containing-hemolysin-like protein
MELLLALLVIAVLILLNGFFVAAEFSIIGVRRSRMEQLAEDGNRTAAWVREVLVSRRKTDRWIATAQLGITLASLGLGMYGEPAIAHLIEGPLHDGLGLQGSIVHSISFIFGLALITYLHVVIGEMVPKSLALQRPEGSVLALTRPMRLVQRVFSIPVTVLNRIGALLLRALRIPPPSKSSRLYTTDELELIVTESAEGGLLESFQEQWAARIFDFSEQWVGQVMTHRTLITALPITASEADLRELIANARFSRVPVYQTNVDDIIGVLHIKEFIRQQLSAEPFDLRALLRDVPFVPKTLLIDEVLTKLKIQRSHMAIVLGEHGGTLGLVTLEDLIEEVMGEVRDEFDSAEESPLILVAPGHIVVQGALLLEELEDYVSIGKYRHDVHTVGGLVMAELDRQPLQGDEISFGDVTMRIEAVERLAVRRVSIRFPADVGPVMD